MRHSSVSISGPLTPDLKSEDKQLTKPSEMEIPANHEEKGFPLPPFKVLIKWLHLYYTQTGAWPEPEELTGTQSPQLATGNNRAAIPENNHATTSSPYENNTHNSGDSPVGGKRLLKIVPVTTAKEKSKDRLKIALSHAASFDFKSSPYYNFALELVGKPTAQTILNEAAVLTLSSLLAWCAHPVFAATYKEKGVGPGMYIPLEQWSKSLKMRKATLSASLKELEVAGLIKSHILTPDGTAKRGYRLAVPLQGSLPGFDPAEAKNNREPVAVAGAEPKLIRSQPAGTQNKPTFATMNHEPNNKNLNKDGYTKPLSTQPINKKFHEHGQPIETGTIDEKLLFLVETASFPGFTSPEGLITLDQREAQKFATTPQLDLNSIKKIYRQSLAAWNNGKCTKNPIGFFHRSLSAYLGKIDPALSMPYQQTLSNFETGPLKEITGTRISKHNGPQFPSQIEVRPDSSPATAEKEPSRAYRNGSAVSKILSAPVSGSPQNSFSELINCEQTAQAVQEQVLAALQDRFKQPELAQLLARLNWKLTLENSKLRLELVNQGPKDSPISLGQSQLSLLKIALSQRLRALAGSSAAIGETFEIEIALVTGDNPGL